jgi:hypothetical protein
MNGTTTDVRLAPSLSLPRSTGEGTLAISILDEGRTSTPSPALAGEGWGGGQ